MTPYSTTAEQQPRPGSRTLLTGAAVVIAYVAAAEIGFRAAFVAEQVTTVWAPTGIAVASLLIWGPRLWPAIWLGAFAVNAPANAPLWTAFVLATGNTLEALVATRLLRRVPQFDFSFRRVTNVLTFVGIAVIASPSVGATIGTATLCAAGAQSWQRFAPLWFHWWLGDALGALVVAPAILTLAAGPRWERPDRFKLAIFVAASLVVTHLAFSRGPGLGAHPLQYVVFPIVIAAALIGGPAVSAVVVLGSSAVTIWNTVGGAGPFRGPEVYHNLILLQTFTGVLAATAMLLSAAIAERKAAELRERDSAHTLRHREEMLRLAQRAGGVATFEWDFQNQLANCSPEFFEMFGLRSRDGAMQGAEWAQFVHPDDRQRMAAHLGRALDRTEPATADYRIIRADGVERWLTYAGQVRETPAGVRMLGSVVDITDRKRAETVLQQAKDAAESANRVKDQFLATLSHELRTPLNAILGYARMLQTNAIPPEKRQRAIDIIERNAAAQNRLIEELLDISRITRGQVRLEPAPTPIGAVLNEALEGVRPAADAKRIALDVDLDPAAGMVTADAARLQQVFWNLLTNAVKFTSQGGRVTASVRRVGEEVEVVVSDTGEGIAPDFLPFVFEPFRQADAKLARRHGGLGLGLAISRQLVELHGGTIRASSAGPGHGATFVVRLPRQANLIENASIRIPAGSERRMALIAGAMLLDGVDILLVDDDEETLSLFRDTLEAAGARIRGVMTAADALGAYDERPPDLLVTDLGLAGIDGVELLRIVRTRNPNIPAVAVTGYARLGDRAGALAAGFQAHVTKPIDPTAFVRALAAALSNAEEGSPSPVSDEAAVEPP
jgi:PAS domain S-box-containing protein